MVCTSMKYFLKLRTRHFTITQFRQSLGSDFKYRRRFGFISHPIKSWKGQIMESHYPAFEEGKRLNSKTVLFQRLRDGLDCGNQKYPFKTFKTYLTTTKPFCRNKTDRFDYTMIQKQFLRKRFSLVMNPGVYYSL